MKYRLLVIANIAFIIGIIIGIYFKGLYLKGSIILFLSIFVLFCLCKMIYKIINKLNFEKKYFFEKLAKKSCSFWPLIKIFIIFIVIGFISLTIKENAFQNFIQDMNYISGNNISKNNVQVYATIVGNKQEKEYTDMYKIKILNVSGKKYFNTYCLIRLDKQQEKFFKYGDLICFKGEFQEPQNERNYSGFSYKEYLKTINVCGIFKTKYNKVKILQEENLSKIFILANKVKSSFERAVR